MDQEDFAALMNKLQSIHNTGFDNMEDIKLMKLQLDRIEKKLNEKDKNSYTVEDSR